MDKVYYVNYLKNYLLEDGCRIVGFDKHILDDASAFTDFVEGRAQLALDELEYAESWNPIPGGAHEMAMEVLLYGLKELEPSDEDKEAEELYQREIATCWAEF